MRQIKTAIAGILALFVASAAVAQTFPTVPGGSVIGRVSTDTGPSQAIPFASLMSRMGGFFGPGTTTDNAIARFDGTSNRRVKNSVVTIDDNGKTFFPDFASASDLTGMVVLGTGGLNNSLRSAFQIRRTLSDAGTSFHGFADNTLFTGITNAGAASFDSRVNYIGVTPNDHFNSYQSILNYNNSAAMQTHQGFVWAPQVNNGQVVTMYGAHFQAPLITAPGVKPTNLAAIAVDDQSASCGAGVCRAVLTTGATASEFGGFVITNGGFIARSPGESMLFQSASNVTQGSIAHNGSTLILSNFLNSSIFFNVNSVNSIEVAPSVMRPVTDAGSALGDSTHRFTTVNAIGIVGTTTNDNALSGNVGEYIENVLVSGSATSLVTGTPKTVVTLSVPAGDWDIDCVLSTLPANTTQVTALAASLSLVTNTLDTTPGRVVAPPHGTITYAGTVASAVPIPPMRFSFATTTNVFCVVSDNFTVSTNVAWGIVRGRRVR